MPIFLRFFSQSFVFNMENSSSKLIWFNCRNHSSGLKAVDSVHRVSEYGMLVLPCADTNSTTCNPICVRLRYVAVCMKLISHCCYVQNILAILHHEPLPLSILYKYIAI